MRLSSVVAGFTAAALLLAPMAQAAPPEDRPQAIESMSLGERLTRIGVGAGLVGGGVASIVTGNALLYTGLAAIGVGAAAAPLIITGVVVGAIGFGAYHLVKGLIGRKLVDAAPAPPAGVNVGRGADTRPRPPVPGRASRPGLGGRAPGAGMPR